MKVALVYDRVNKWGGAERVLLSLHKLFPDAPLYTSVYNPQGAPWAKVFDVRTSFLQDFPFASSSHEYYAMLMPLAFESFSFDEFDMVISVTSEAAKGIITKPGTLHVCYCLTPTRYLWSGYDEYFKDTTLRTLSSPFISYLRKWDKQAALRPDAFIAISKEVQSRIKKYYDRDSDLVYPPVSLQVHSSQFTVHSKNDERTNELTNNKQGYFLVVSRLVPYKKVDIAIEACNRLKLPLKIVGTGSEEQRLRLKAGENVELLGNLTQEELVVYYKGCSALIVPGIEDFGLAALEAQYFGKPVIALSQGGALETVVKGKTGEFFYPQNPNELSKVLQTFDKSKYNAEECKKNAQKFSENKFKQAFLKAVKKIESEYRI